MITEPQLLEPNIRKSGNILDLFLKLWDASFVLEIANWFNWFQSGMIYDSTPWPPRNLPAFHLPSAFESNSEQLGYHWDTMGIIVEYKGIHVILTAGNSPNWILPKQFWDFGEDLAPPLASDASSARAMKSKGSGSWRPKSSWCLESLGYL